MSCSLLSFAELYLFYSIREALLLMDSYCVGLRVNPHVPKPRKHGFISGDSAFWGEKIRGRSVKDNGVKRDKKVKPGAAFAIMTSDTPTDIAVAVESLF